MIKTAHELVMEAKKSIVELPSAEVHNKLGDTDILLIDVREPDEYRQGHITGAVNIPRGMLEFKISNEPALQNLMRPIILYCKTSGRAALSAVTLKSMGFENIQSMAGGFDSWVAEGYPVAQPRDISFE
jgi:rhodanese-related sulfurtransferase